MPSECQIFAMITRSELAQIQAENLQNVQKNSFFGKKLQELESMD